MGRGAHWLALFGGLAGCATSLTDVSHTVDPEIVEVFPPDGRRWTYEAENEVVIALDRLNAARDHLAEAEKNLDAGKDAKSAGSKEVGSANIDWLKTRLELAEAQLNAAERGVTCAQANLELTKAKLALRFDMPVPAGFEVPFEKQYNECAQTLDERKLEVERLLTKSIEAKDSWRKLRIEYVRRSGDHDHGLWIE